MDAEGAPLADDGTQQVIDTLATDDVGKHHLEFFDDEDEARQRGVGKRRL